MSLEINNLYNIDCISGMKQLPDNFIDLTITSPPYNVGIEYDSYNDKLSYVDYLSFTKSWLKELYRISKNDSRICINIPFNMKRTEWNEELRSVYSDVLNTALSLNFKYNNSIIWYKQNISKRTAWGSYCSASDPYLSPPLEAILVLNKDKRKKTSGSLKSSINPTEFQEYTSGFWSFNGEQHNPNHPAPFPIELPTRCLKLFSYIDDLILDPFCGTGATAIACARNNRNYIGFDISKNYIDKANYELSIIPEIYKQVIVNNNTDKDITELLA